VLCCVREDLAKGRSLVQGVFQVLKNGRPYSALVCRSMEEEEEEDEDEDVEDDNFNSSLIENNYQLLKELFNAA
jgi:hypothetical protein